MNQGPIIQGNAVVFLRARVLTTDGRNHASETSHVESQRELCRATAERIGALIVREYVEYGGTGPISGRPILRRMLGDLTTLLGVRYVLVANVDRLARMPRDVTAIHEAIQATGAHVLACAELSHSMKGGSW
jgi:DNA invertase Pin-like site-specific DNA recombinase